MKCAISWNAEAYEKLHSWLIEQRQIFSDKYGPTGILMNLHGLNEPVPVGLTIANWVSPGARDLVGLINVVVSDAETAIKLLPKPGPPPLRPRR